MKNYSNKEEEFLRSALTGNEKPFHVPNGYFEELPSNIMDQINALPDLNNTSTVNPFNIPEGYFENLPSSITEIIVKHKSRTESWFERLFRPRIAIPIAFATIFFLAGLYFYKQKSIVIPPVQQLSADDLRNTNYLLTMDEYLFVDVLAGQKEVLSDKSIEQYLIDNNIELSQLENKL